MEEFSAPDILEWAIRAFGNSFAIATSFQKEGMVILEMAHRIDPHTRVFTIDTGRLPAETVQMIDTVRRRYRVEIEVLRPDPNEVARMVQERGADQPSARGRRCCGL